MDGFFIKETNGCVTLPENAKISLGDLRCLSVKHVGFDGRVHDGELVCNKKLAKELLEIFEELFKAGYPIEKIKPADKYGGDDDKIMSDNASSCFNYRCVANTTELSMHALGKAVDINPLYNPYIQNGVIMPENAKPYADRMSDFPHKITHDDVCYKIFASHGWKWGGDWGNSKDYQHFYKVDGGVKGLVRKVRVKLTSNNTV